MGKLHYIGAIAILAAFGATGCSTRGPVARSDSGAPESLTLIVTELRMHLREDPYRSDRAKTRDGRNAYHTTLWKLDRLARQRAADREALDNVDLVIEFARGRCLERLRRYDEAIAAYGRAADAGSTLLEPAQESATLLTRFAAAATPLPSHDPERLGSRVRAWRDIAWSLRATHYHALALRELEAWEMLRVDSLARSEPIDVAIAAQKRLIERHAESLLYSTHLIQLGDLFAAAARRASLRGRARPESFQRARYERLLDRAFSAYEAAAKTRVPHTRQEAETRIDALLAYHDEVSTRAR